MNHASRSLRVNMLFAIGGMGLYSLCQLLVTALLAKFASARAVGDYAYGLAVSSPVVLLFSLELRGAFVADVGGEFPYSVYRRLRNAAAAAAAVCLALVVAWRALRDVDAPAVALLACICAAKIAWQLAELDWGAFQRRERLDLVAAAAALRGLALLAPFAVLLPAAAYTGWNPATATALAAGIWAASWWLILPMFERRRAAPAAESGRPAPWRDVRRLAWQTLPLGVVATVVNLCDSLPRLLIASQPGGREALGYYAALAYVTLAGNLVAIQASNAAANRLSLYYWQDRAAFVRLLARLLATALTLGAGLCVAAWFAGEWFLRVLYRSDYAAHHSEFMIIIAAQSLALMTNVLGVTATQMRLFMVQSWMQALVLAATLVAALAWIPADPLRGAALTALTRAVVQFVLYAGCVAGGLVWRSKRVIAGPPGALAPDPEAHAAG
ncbi:hypothetical protein RAS1_42720 [Phycisphaerae bacterium RAS1]|nr:hypothetical protein RAS1_42720 [Phycisphaerae bacterium RAS1]